MTGEVLRILHAFADPPSVPSTASAVEAGSLALTLDPLFERLRYHVQPACSRGDLLRRLNQVRPHVLHIGGHGSPDGSVLLMHPDSGDPSPLAKQDLAGLLAGRSELRLVVFSCCHGLVGVEALAESVAAVVGVSGTLHEPYPVVFAASLYHSLAHGRSIVQAFRGAVVDADERRPTPMPRFELWTPPHASRSLDPPGTLEARCRPAARSLMSWSKPRGAVRRPGTPARCFSAAAPRRPGAPG